MSATGIIRAVVTAASLAVVASPLGAQVPVIQEFPVPWERTRPRDPWVDREGNVWFVGQTGHYVARFDPRTQQFQRFDLEQGAGPHNLIVDDRGMVWYSGNLRGYIGRLDPRDGSITRFPMPDSTVRDPHTLIFDRNGDIWFTAQQANVIGKLTVSTGQIRLVRPSVPRARPYGIVMDPRGERPWIVLFGTNRIATVDPRSFELTEYEIPRPEARPRRLAVTTDGAVWYGDYAAGMLGRFDPASRSFEEYPLPSGQRSGPYAMTVDDQDRIWVVETRVQPNQFVGFDSRTRRVVATAPVPSGGGAVRHMFFHRPTRTIWFGTDTNQLGRGQVSSPVP